MENADFEEIRRGAINEAKRRNYGGFLRFLDESKVYDESIKRDIMVRMTETSDDPIRLFLQAARKAYLQLDEEYRHDYEKIDRTIWLSNGSHADGAVFASETIWSDEENRKLRKINKLLNEKCVPCGICAFNGKSKTRHEMQRSAEIIDHMVVNHGLLELYGCHCCNRCFTTLAELRNHDCETYQTFMISQSLNREYKGDIHCCMFFLICTDCGLFHSILSRLSDFHTMCHFSSLIDFYKLHSPKNLVLGCVYSEDTFTESPVLSFQSSLGVDLKISCSDCNIEAFDSIQQSREHFMVHHSNQLMRKCPKKECDLEFENDVLLNEHVLQTHVKNGILAYFMKHNASIRTKRNGIMRPDAVVRKRKIDKLSFHIGGISYIEDIPMVRLPPKNEESSKHYKATVKMTESLAKVMKIDPKRFDFKFADANLKMSKYVYKGKGKAKQIRMKLGKMKDSIKVDEKLLEGCQITTTMPLRIADDEIRDKAYILREKIGFCGSCKVVLNGKTVTDKHPCQEEIKIISEHGQVLNRQIRCPQCYEHQCSITGLLYHLYAEHNKLCTIEADELDENPPQPKVMEVTKQINKMLGLNEDGSYPNDRNMFEHRDIKQFRRIESTTPRPGELHQNNNLPMYPDQIHNSMHGARVEITEQTTIDIGQILLDQAPTNNGSSVRIEEIIDDRAECVTSKTPESVFSERSSVTPGDDGFLQPFPVENYPLLDHPPPSVICLSDFPTGSQESSSMQRRIREENEEMTPNMNTHTATTEDDDDDIIIIEDIEKQQKHHQRSIKMEPAEPNHKTTVLNDGDDECMAIAHVEIQNQVEKTKSMRAATHKCPWCSKTFMTVKSLENHKAEDHGNDFNDLWDEDMGIPLDPSATFLLCLSCTAAFEDYEDFKAHRAKHRDSEAVCELCSGIVLCRENLEEHRQKHVQMSFICSQCKPMERFKEEGHLLHHMKHSHSVNLLYFCKACGCARNSFDEMFYMHLINCKIARSNPPNIQPSMLVGCITASTVTYQPKNRDKYKAELAANPANFSLVTECGHRSFIRFGDAFYTCLEKHPNGELCNGMIAQFRFNAFAEFNNLRIVIREKQSVGADINLIDSTFHRLAEAIRTKNNVTARRKRQRKQKEVATTSSAQNAVALIEHRPVENSLPVNVIGRNADGNPICEPRITTIFNSPANALVEETLGYNSSLACIFCGCDVPRYLIRVNRDHIPTMITHIYNIYHQLPANPEKLTPQELYMILNRRINIAHNCYAVKCGQSLSFSICKDHFADDYNGHVFLPLGAVPTRLPYSLMPPFPKLSQPPVIQQIKYRFNNSMLQLPSTSAANPQSAYQQAVVAANLNQMMPYAKHARPRGPMKRCQLCFISKMYYHFEFDSSLMIQLDEVPEYWKIELCKVMMARKLFDNAPDAKIWLDSMLTKGTHICIRHFLPHSYEMRNNGLQYCGPPLGDFPMLSIEFCEVVTLEFRQRLNYLISILNDPRIELSRYNAIIGELRQKTTCYVCGTVMTSAYELRLHRLHDSTETGFCMKCYGQFECRSLCVKDDIARHVANVHGIREVKTRLICPFGCPDTFQSTIQLRFHLAEAHREADTLISVCGLGFKSRASLNYHNQSHKNNKTMECCVLCGYVGAQFNNEIGCRHDVIHTFSTVVHCNICFEGFGGAHGYQLLQNHFQTSHQEGFKCTKCAYTLTRSTMAEHMGTHVFYVIHAKPNTDEAVPLVTLDESFLKYTS